MSLIEKCLNSVYKKSTVVPFDKGSKIIIMSDCHRGQGNAADNFLANQNLFFGALNYYYKAGYTYIELGDGDELWENRKMKPIIDIHSDAFWMMSRFHNDNRFYMLNGNHDVVKRRCNFTRKNCCVYYQNSIKKNEPLFQDLIIHEGLILENKDTGKRIFMAHGHQGDLLNDIFWPVARFLVRYIWKPLELIGFLDPTGAGREHKDFEKSEKKFASYADKQGMILILGHTHRPVYSKPGEGLYFNDGSCVHPRCITGIEIENNRISLIKWSVQTREDGNLFVGREVLESPTDIIEYYL